jgi:acetoin utilization protein AcuC
VKSAQPPGIRRPGWKCDVDGETAAYPNFFDGHNPADPVERAIVATMRAVFPAHGLDMNGIW